MITINLAELKAVADRSDGGEVAVVSRRWLRAIHQALTHPTETMLLKDGQAPEPMVVA